MMSPEENRRLTETRRGTPVGALLRRHWQRVALARELPAGCAPLPVRVVAEDLVLLRDDRDRIGLVETRCSHRGAASSFGPRTAGASRAAHGSPGTPPGVAAPQRPWWTTAPVFHEQRREIFLSHQVPSPE